MERRFDVGKGSVTLVVGDITQERTEAIANAANSSLLGGGGVDGAIHRAAGRELLAACKAAKETLPEGRLPTGQAVMTPGFQLRAAFVIHCVGPIYGSDARDAPLLASCYTNAMRLCAEHGLDSVAFPSISTGVYGYPVDRAAPVALTAVRDALVSNARPSIVRFVLFDRDTYAAYERAAQELFG